MLKILDERAVKRVVLFKITVHFLNSIRMQVILSVPEPSQSGACTSLQMI